MKTNRQKAEIIHSILDVIEQISNARVYLGDVDVDLIGDSDRQLKKFQNKCFYSIVSVINEEESNEDKQN